MRFSMGVFLILLSLVSSALAGEVRLSAAASMTEATRELIATYQQQVPGASIFPNFASSGTLAKQISQGAPVDIFISANPDWMNYLLKQNSISAQQVRTLAFNSLVFVGLPTPSVSSLQDISQLSLIALGSPQSVPAGQYAEQALKSAGLYDALRGKLVMAKDVRQALVYADRGETDGAFVYRTDALLAQKAAILFSVPQALYQEVSYPVGLTLEGARNPEALAFLEFLGSSEAAAILTRFGFMVK